MSNGIHARLKIVYPDFSLDVDLDLPGRGVTALFGPSGSGKTTCLRVMAGLERGFDSHLEVNGEIWQDDAKGIFVPTHLRSIGYVFQDAALFSHLNVRANLEYGLKRVRTAMRRVSFDRIVELLGIGELLKRSPARLSGGERQRVAIARALLTSPRILLMDEPLAALDIGRRQEILPYLQALHAELEIPVIYVSHSMDEVARLANYLVLLAAGKQQASGPLVETLARLDLPTALTDQAGVVIEGIVAEHDERYRLTRLTFAGGHLLVTGRNDLPGTSLRVHVLARDVSVTLTEQHDTSILNRLPAEIVAVTASDTPAHILLRLDAGGTPLLARITRRSYDQLDLARRRHVWAQIKTVALLA